MSTLNLNSQYVAVSDGQASLSIGDNLYAVDNGLSIEIGVQGVVVVVNHGSLATTFRPDGAVQVMWIGSVKPNMMTPGDLWLNPTNGQIASFLNVEMLTNYNFNTDTSQWTAVAGSLTQISSAQAHIGSAQITADGSAAVQLTSNQTQNISSGQQFTASIYVRPSATISMVAKIGWLDTTYGNYSETAGTAVSLSTNSWTKVSVTGTAPSSAVHCFPSFATMTIPSSNMTLLYDDASLQRVA